MARHKRHSTRWITIGVGVGLWAIAQLGFAVVEEDPSQDIPLEVKRSLMRGDVDDALAWLQTAASNGHVQAAFTLGKMYSAGSAGLSKDLSRAAQYFEMAAWQGEVEAQYLLGLLYQRQGRSDAATGWLQKAALAGHADALRRAEGEISIKQDDLFTLIATQSPGERILNSSELNQHKENGETPLIYAAKTKKMAWVVYLARHKPTVAIDAVDEFSNTALHYAAQANHLESVRTLLDAGAPLHAVNHRGATALHLAVAGDGVEAAQLLLKRGARLDTQDKEGWSPRMLAMRSSSPQMAHLAGGAQIKSQPLPSESKALQAALLREVKSNRVAQVTKLLDAGADPHTKNAMGVGVLAVAINNGSLPMTRALVDHGALLPDDHAPMMALAIRAQASEIVAYLANKVDQMDFVDAEGRGWLHHAVLAECVECITTLLSKGVDPLQQTRKGETPLILAVRSGFDGAVEPLLAGAEAAIETSDDQGRTALWWAVAKNQPTSVRALLARGATLRVDDQGRGPLQLAVEQADKALLEAFVEMASLEQLELVTPAGNTLMHLAARRNNASALAVLLQKGVAVDPANHDGDTPLMVAVREQALEAATLLVQKGASIHRRNLQMQNAAALMGELGEDDWLALRDSAPSELSSLFARLTGD